MKNKKMIYPSLLIEKTKLLFSRKGFQIFFLATLIRIVFVGYAIKAGPDFYLTDDSQRYDRLALNLIHRFQFRAEAFTMNELGLSEGFELTVLKPGYLTDKYFFSGPEVKRVPLFTLFLGFIYLIFGYHPFVYLFIQAFIGGITCWLIYLIGMQINIKKAGYLGGLLLAINPRSILHIGQIQVEPFFIFMLVITFYFGLRFVQKPSWPRVILFTSVLGWTTLTREMGVFSVIIFSVFIFYPAFRRQNIAFRSLLLKMSILILVPILVISGWMMRNKHFYGYYSWTAHTAFSEAWYFAPMVMSTVWKSSEEDSRMRLLQELVDKYPEYRTDLERLRKDSAFYWKFNHRVEMNMRAVPIARKYLLRYLPKTVYVFASGSFWSYWSGLGEWRNIVISNSEYKNISILIKSAKTSLFRLHIVNFIRVLYKLLSSVSKPVLFFIFFLLCYMVFIFVCSIFGLYKTYKTFLLIALQISVIILFACFVSGPAGNNRLLSFIYPFMCLLSGIGLQKTKYEPVVEVI